MVDPSVASQQRIRPKSSPISFRSSSQTGRWVALQMQSIWGFQGAGSRKCWHVGGWIMRKSIIAWVWLRIAIAIRYLHQMIRTMCLIHSVNYQWQWLCVIKHGTTGIKTGKNSIKLWFSFLIWKRLFMTNVKKKLVVLLGVPRKTILLFSHQPMAFLDVSQLLLLIIRTSSNRLT